MKSIQKRCSWYLQLRKLFERFDFEFKRIVLGQILIKVSQVNPFKRPVARENSEIELRV